MILMKEGREKEQGSPTADCLSGEAGILGIGTLENHSGELRQVLVEDDRGKKQCPPTWENFSEDAGILGIGVLNYSTKPCYHYFL